MTNDNYDNRQIVLKQSNKERGLIDQYKSSVDYFLGRSSELLELESKLSKNHLVCLRGIAGIGKSELAKQYSNQKRMNYYRNVVYTSYQLSIKETLTSQVKTTNQINISATMRKRYIFLRKRWLSEMKSMMTNILR